MDEQQLRDLIEGRNDWLNIQDVLRNTFKRINDVVSTHSSTIAVLENSFKIFVERQEKKVERLEKIFEQVDRKLTSVIEIQEDQDRRLEAKAESKDLVLKADLKTTSKEIEQMHNSILRRLDQKVDVTDFQETFTELKGATQLTSLLQQKADIEDVQTALTEFNKLLDKKVDSTKLDNLLRDKASFSTVHELLAQKVDLAQVQELMKEKANKSSVSAALKRKANKDETDEQYNTLKKQFDQLRSEMDKPVDTAELERVLAKHTTELNRIILDMDLKPSRAEVNDILENHLQTVQQFVLQKEAENEKFCLDEVFSLKSELSEVSKKLEKKVEVLEFTKVLKTKASTGDVDELADSLRKIEKELRIDSEEVKRVLTNKVDVMEMQKWNVQRAKQGISNDTEEYVEDRLRLERTKTKEYMAELEKIIATKASKDELYKIAELKLDRADGISIKQWNNLEKKLEDNINLVVEEQDIKIKDLELRTSDLQALIHDWSRKTDELSISVEQKASIPLVRQICDERTRDLTQLLDIKADLKELQQVRKDNSDLGKQILEISRKLPRKPETFEESAPQVNSAVERISVELQALNNVVRKKADRNEVLELIRLKIDAGQLDSMQFATMPQVAKLLKVDQNELMQQLANRITREEVMKLIAERPTTNNGVADNSMIFENLIENHSKLKSWMEHSLHKIERTLQNKVETDELLQVKETLNRKLDIATFLESKNEMLTASRTQTSFANNRSFTRLNLPTDSNKIPENSKNVQ